MRIILITVVALLTACGSSGARGRPTVVAAENVYGDIAAQLAGGHARVSSILSDPNADPHLFEAGTANGLAVAHAEVVIRNGLGYDAFVDSLEAAAPSRDRVTVTVADVLGVHGSAANPHLWYDVPSLGRIARAIEAALVRVDAKHAAAYRAGLGRFDASLEPLRRAVASLRAGYGGAAVASTEPVGGYLLAAAGLRDLAPSSFARPIEEGTEPSPGAVAAMLDLVRTHRVRVLLYNRQAVSPVTARVRTAAHAAGVPVVALSETLPANTTFQAWQLAQVHELQAALAR
jgi:zinc/manganese transport system substrate-binding protein